MNTKPRFTTLLLTALLITISTASVAKAAVVITQTQDRAYETLWLLSDWIQQDTAHRQVWADHEVMAIPYFDDAALAGGDIVYLSPALDELKLTEDEIDALLRFVENGGRLIIPADYGDWANEFRALAARFDVVYGDTYINGYQIGETQSYDNPITNGPAGFVNEFTAAAINNELSSNNPEFQALSVYQVGTNAIGYIEHGTGHVVFLTDFSTFDNDMLFRTDNQTLWTNLFEHKAPGSDCLKLNVENLTAGQTANFTITKGTPGTKAITVYGTRPGSTTINGYAKYCADFGIKNVNQDKVIGGQNRAFDNNGEITFNQKIPANTQGLGILIQSAMQNTCPDDCMSNLIQTTIQ